MLTPDEMEWKIFFGNKKNWNGKDIKNGNK